MESHILPSISELQRCPPRTRWNVAAGHITNFSFTFCPIFFFIFLVFHWQWSLAWLTTLLCINFNWYFAHWNHRLAIVTTVCMCVCVCKGRCHSRSQARCMWKELGWSSVTPGRSFGNTCVAHRSITHITASERENGSFRNTTPVTHQNLLTFINLFI